MKKIWVYRFRDLAEHVSSWSKDPDRKVGAVIVDIDHRVLGLGFNGLPRRANDSAQRDRDHKVRISVHAEANAILNSQQDTRGCSIFVNRFPCEACAGLIIQAGVSHVYAPIPNMNHPRWGKAWHMAFAIFMECGVNVHYYED